MGGGGGKTPDPKTFTPPPLQDAPVSARIPNFFGGQQASPFAMTGQAPANPFQAMQGALPGILQMRQQLQGQQEQEGIDPMAILEALRKMRDSRGAG